MWKFNKSNLTITLTEPYGYEIDLERCNSSAEVLDWIVQIAKKTWATDAIVADLVRTLDRLLDLQGNLCSFGMDKKGFVAKRFLESREGQEHRYVTSEILGRYLKKDDSGIYSAGDLHSAYTEALKHMPKDA